MAKPKLPNQKKKYYQLERRTMRYLQLIHSIYETHTREASRIALLTDYDKGGGKPFRFEDYPQTRYAVEQLQMSFAGSLQATIVSGIDAEWENADLAHEQFMDIVRKRMRGVLTEKRLNERFAKIYSNREGALEAFKKRSDRGLNLSSRVWNQSEDYRRGLETVLSVGIEKGMSAVTLSKRVSKYLNDFDEIKDDYKQLFGKATTIKDCEFNSQRLARTEINMAYRTAEQRRWQEEDYIVGFEVKRGRRLKNDKGETGDYPCAVCSMLKGRYPKDFKFVGWHPMCRCYVVPIMKTDEEFFADTPAKESENYVGDVPENFKQWIEGNKDRILDAHNTRREPYFVKDNWGRIKGELDLNATKKGMKFGNGSRKEKNEAQKIYADNAKTIISKEQEQNIKDIARQIGVKYKGTMSFADADKGRANVDKFVSKKFKENCAVCVAVHEARLRGLDITSLGYTKNENNIIHQLGKKTNLIWKNKQGNSPSFSNVINDITDMNFALQQIEKSTQKQGRYHIGFDFSSSDGHIIAAERISNGKLILYDPQTNEYPSFDVLPNFVKVEIMRVDNMLFDVEILKAISRIL